MPSRESTSSPDRRSDVDLQRILDSLIGDADHILVGDLPYVLDKYEKQHNTAILTPSDHAGLRELAATMADMELGPQDLFKFLSMIQKSPVPVEPEAPPPPATLPHSASLPPSAFASHSQSTPVSQIREQQNRRHSDRIRSPSDSSSNSEDESTSNRDGRKQASSAFPISSHAITPSSSLPLHPVRKKTLSDPSRLNSPLGMRTPRTGAGPPSAFGNVGFARPSPASRRRRGSSGAYASDTESTQSPEKPPYFSRSTSNHSVAASTTSPTWPMTRSRASTPSSPGVDHTSFHIRAKSPEEIADDEINAAEDGFVDAEVESQQDDDLNESEDVLGESLSNVGEALNPRLSRISTGSTSSLRTSHDKVQALQKQNSELNRKLKETERQRDLLGADNDRMVVDLERQLEEARHELSQKRKEDKELRGHELKQNIQISGLEADLANVQRSLEQSKEHRASMQKMYDSQCDEAQRLRDLLRDRDNEIRNMEETLHDHEADEEKVNRQIQALEAEVKRLEVDLVVARKAETVLETQKQENLQLKETIDRMRFDLDEARTALANGVKSGHLRSSTNGSSIAGTLSRNLGDEITRRLQAAEAVEEEETEDTEDDSIIETVVTTQRTRKKGNRAASSNIGASGDAAIEPLEIVREYADISTDTDPVRVIAVNAVNAVSEDNIDPLVEAGPSTLSALHTLHEHPPAYSAKPDPVNAQQVLDAAHPREVRHIHDNAVDEEYGVLAETLGMRCHVLEEELKARQAERDKLGHIDPRSRRRRTPFADRRKSYSKTETIHHIFVNAGESVQAGMTNWIVWSVAIFAVGLVAGQHLLPGHAGLHPRDVHLFAHMNDIARSFGAGEGILPHSAKGLAGMMGAAGAMYRVPT